MPYNAPNVCRLLHRSNSFLHICARQRVKLWLYSCMNSDNNYVPYWTLGSIHVVLHKYSFFIVDHLLANVRVGKNQGLQLR